MISWLDSELNRIQSCLYSFLFDNKVRRDVRFDNSLVFFVNKEVCEECVVIIVNYCGCLYRICLRILVKMKVRIVLFERNSVEF